MRQLAVVLLASSACYHDVPAPPAPVPLAYAEPRPTRSAFVFVSGRESQNRWSQSQIYLADGRHQEPVNLTNDANYNSGPAISPDGTQMVFLSSRGTGLFVMALDGEDVRELAIQTNGQPASPRWAPTNRIAYLAPAYSTGTSVWTIDESGGSPRRLTSPGPEQSDDGGFAFIDGGKRLVFSRYDRATSERHLYVANADGSGTATRFIAMALKSETLPVVSHDGRLLAFRAALQGKELSESIRIVSVADGSLVRDIPLAPPAHWNINGIDFTVDDRKLLFGADATDVGGDLGNIKGELFSVDVDGQHLRRLTKNAAYDGQPAVVPI